MKKLTTNTHKIDLHKLANIYESFTNKPPLLSLVENVMKQLLKLETLDEFESFCNDNLYLVGQGRETAAYSKNGVIIKFSERDKSEWQQYSNLPCFCQTEMYEAPFGLVILQEELTIDSSEYWDNDVESDIIACLESSGLPYDIKEVTDENVGMNENEEWKLFDIPLN